MKQSDFWNVPDKRKERKLSTRSHPGECVMDFDPLGLEEWPPLTLRCSLDKAHRYSLVGSTRQAVMVTFLERGMLTGKALTEANVWDSGETPTGFYRDNGNEHTGRIARRKKKA